MNKEDQDFYAAIEANTLEQNKELQLVKKAEIDEFEKQLRAKKYALDYTNAQLDDLVHFLGTEVTFKGGESLGLVQLDKELRKVSVSNGVLLLTHVLVEAVYFFLSRHEGKTLTDAKAHQNVFQPFTRAYEGIRTDGAAFKKLAELLNAVEQAVAFQEETKRSTQVVEGQLDAAANYNNYTSDASDHVATAPVKSKKKKHV